MRRKRICFVISIVVMGLIIGCGGSGDTSTGTSEEPKTEVVQVEAPSNDQVENTVEKPSPDVSETETEQSPEDIQELKKVDDQEYIEVVADDVRVRSSASTDTNDNILGKAKKGQKYIKTGDEGDWSKLSFDGKDGFIKSEFIKTISKEEFEANQETVKSTPEEAEENKTETKAQNDVAQLAQQQQEAMLAQQQQQEALLAQQQQQAAAASSNSGGGGGTYENTQLRSDRIVYITPTGKKYHYDKECAGKNAIPKNLDEVTGAYGPCGTCVLQ